MPTVTREAVQQSTKSKVRITGPHNELTRERHKYRMAGRTNFGSRKTVSVPNVAMVHSDAFLRTGFKFKLKT